jgi:hypothetical protein
MDQYFITSDCAIGLANGARKSRAGGCQYLKSQNLQQTRGASTETKGKLAISPRRERTLIASQKLIMLGE